MMHSYDMAYRWRRLHTVDGVDVRRRWKAAQHVQDNLLGYDHVCKKCKTTLTNRDEFAWVIRTRLELVRLIGALQHYNPKMALWFRGEGEHYPNATPAAFRDNRWESCIAGWEWINSEKVLQKTLIRDRSPLAKWAILQHYGYPTPLLDVTRDWQASLQFALFEVYTISDPPRLQWKENPCPHISVFATPRPEDSVNIFDDMGICLVDLPAELPSYCLRPHVQGAAFLGLTDVVQKALDQKALDQKALDLENIQYEHDSSPTNYILDPIRIARIYLDFPKGFTEIFKKFYDVEMLFPTSSKPDEGKRSDLNSDFMLRTLYELKKQYSPRKIPSKGFPNYFYCTHQSY